MIPRRVRYGAATVVLSLCFLASSAAFASSEDGREVIPAAVFAAKALFHLPGRGPGKTENEDL